MWSTAREVAAGDTVIIWLTRDQVQPLVITPGKDFNTKFGNFRQADFVGVPYGSKVPSRSGRGFIHILRPTPELWTIALPHRTQILYLADIAFITSHLNIRHGSKVIEAGTGSASFSHSVARNIGPLGHLYSYEFHEARYIKAKEEFTRHGMDDTVTIQHRNVCKEGFTVVDEVDSVFLDLPAPWEAVEHAKKALRKDRVTRICCFSPCMEQVLRTVNALNEAGFSEITMYETLLRPIEVFQTPQLQSISTVSENIKLSEIKREEKRLRQIAANKANASALANTKTNPHAKRKRPEGEDEEQEGEQVTNAHNVSELGIDKGIRDAKTERITSATGPDASGSGSGSGKAISISAAEGSSQHKRIKTDNPANTTQSLVLSEELEQTAAVFEEKIYEMDGVEPTTVEETDEMDVVQANNLSAAEIATSSANDSENGRASKPTVQSRKLRSNNPTPGEDGTPIPKINVSKALPEVRGHTSYLTFACLIPNPNHNSNPNPIADAISTSTATTTTTTATTSVTTPAAASVADADNEAVDAADPAPEENDLVSA